MNMRKTVIRILAAVALATSVAAATAPAFQPGHAVPRASDVRIVEH